MYRVQLRICLLLTAKIEILQCKTFTPVEFDMGTTDYMYAYLDFNILAH